jgi:putative DNA primase/helicase
MYGGKGMTAATLSDFAQYDTGRKFPLASLIHSRVNWASENTNNVKLDGIQSLKCFVTGESLDSEQKEKMHKVLSQLVYLSSTLMMFLASKLL